MEEDHFCCCHCLGRALVEIVGQYKDIGSLFQGMSNTMWPLIFWRAFTGLFAGSQILVQA